MMWPLIAALSGVASLNALQSPRSLVLIGAVALAAYVAFAPRPPPPPAAEPPPLSRLGFVRRYTKDVDEVAIRLDEFMKYVQGKNADPKTAEMMRDSLVQDVLALTYSVPYSCRDSRIVDAARSVYALTTPHIKNLAPVKGVSLLPKIDTQQLV